MSAAKNTYDTIQSRLRTKDVIGWLEADQARHDYYVYIRGLLDNGD